MSERGRLHRIWMATPDWFFRALGAVIFAALIGLEIWDFVDKLRASPDGFLKAFLTFGVYWRFNQSSVLYLPWGRVLVILTYVLVGLSFVVRMPPLKRASRPREIVIPIIAAYWPILPFLAKRVIGVWWPSQYDDYEAVLLDRQMGFPRFMAGTGLVVMGNILDVWGYAVLCRSFSLVAEARELKVTGPYRLIRHPVYFGQILAQAGIWLFYVQISPVWWAFFLCFVAMQLYRSKVEDEVLERAFGESYLSWKRKTLWFF